MEEFPVLYSLHRPFHKPLKSTKWVCQFINTFESNNRRVKPSTFYNDFFFYLLKQLNKEYRKNITDIEGVPSIQTVKDVVEYFNTIKKDERNIVLKKILEKRVTNLDRKIYTTYKAASYYINLCKEKLDLVDDKYRLNIYGKQLVSIRSSFFELSNNEKLFFFERIFKNDGLLIITKCFSEKLKSKYSLSNPHLIFIQDKYKINYFKFVQNSINVNYENVRSYWIETLSLLDKNNNIKKKYLGVINKNEEYKSLYVKIKADFEGYFEDVLQFKNKLYLDFEKIETLYKQLEIKGLHDLGFVNLYDIKKEFKISNERFQIMLNQYYEQKRKKKLILFSNTVSSIDKRKRFYIKNIPVIKIKIL